MLVQETREFTDGAVDKLKREARGIGWSAVASPAWRTAADSGSAGCAVLAARGIGLAEPPGLVIKESVRHRIVIGWGSAMLKGGVHLASLCLKDGAGLNDDNLELLQELALLLGQIKGPWIVGADWNINPSTLEASKWPELVRGVIVSTATPTCFSNTYDFFVVSEGLAPAVAGIARVEDAALHPHRPARLFVQSDARRFLTRQLTKPDRVPGLLPAGPLPRPVEHRLLYPAAVDKEATDAAARRWMIAARNEWASLTGALPDYAEPKFKGRPAVGPKAEAYAGASACSHWWRLSGRRLDECAVLLLRAVPVGGRIAEAHLAKMTVSAKYAGFSSAEADAVNR